MKLHQLVSEIDKESYSHKVPIMTMLKVFVTFFGVGLSPKAPGTMGTAAAIPFALLLIWSGPFIHMFAAMALALAAIVACEKYEKQIGGHDHSHIVIDEVVGFLITMTWLPITWQSVLAGFVLFRLFDIWKPWPIRHFDKKVAGGLGVVVDDIVAGIFANIILQLLYTKTNLLGVQIL